MNYEQTLLALDTIDGSFALVYSADGGNATEPGDFTTGGLTAAGIFKRDHKDENRAAAIRRYGLTGEAGDAVQEWLQRLTPELDLGDLPLEQYAQQAAYFTFEGMDNMPRGFAQSGRYVGFPLWRHDFVESEWLEFGVRPDWLWIRSRSSGVVVVAEFPERVSEA